MAKKGLTTHTLSLPAALKGRIAERAEGRPLSHQVCEDLVAYYDLLRPEWYKQFEWPGQAINMMIYTVPDLYAHGLAEIKERFSAGELKLIIDAANGLMLLYAYLASTSSLYGHLEDACNLDHLDEKWRIDRDAFLGKIRSLTAGQTMALQLWADLFWTGKREGQEPGIRTDLEEYVQRLAKGEGLAH